MSTAILESHDQRIRTLDESVVTASTHKRGDAHYNEFYRKGGWKYSFVKEYLWHRRHFVNRFDLRRGMTGLEVACGNGFHTNLLCRMGLDFVGVDRSEAGIEWARSHFPRATYHCCDLMGDIPVDKGSRDVVYARGCSNYHYDQMSPRAMDTTNHLLSYLKPGGVFVMVIVTNLSGKKESGSIWHNTLEDYKRHFSSFGLDWSVDWVKGMVICGLRNRKTLGQQAVE